MLPPIHYRIDRWSGEALKQWNLQIWKHSICCKLDLTHTSSLPYEIKVCNCRQGEAAMRCSSHQKMNAAPAHSAASVRSCPTQLTHVLLVASINNCTFLSPRTSWLWSRRAYGLSHFMLLTLSCSFLSHHIYYRYIRTGVPPTSALGPWGAWLSVTMC